MTRFSAPTRISSKRLHEGEWRSWGLLQQEIKRWIRVQMLFAADIWHRTHIGPLF